MSYYDHSFDWKGFKFSLVLIAACLVIGTGVNFGFPYAQSYFAPAKPVAVVSVAVQAAPLIPVAEATVVVSSTTPQKVINTLTIADAVPAQGKFIAADLVNMKLYLYQDGTTTAEYPILTKGKPGTPYETPGGFYNVLFKDKELINGWEHVSMPYSLEFFGNYFIHGWPTYADGTPVASTYSGGCIRLSTADAAKVFAFADTGTGVFVYDTGAATSAPDLALGNIPVPPISAASYLVADVDTGDVYAEQSIDVQRPIASVTKLMTALVANEFIMFDRKMAVPRGELNDINVATDTTPETFVIGDLLYPLLMESNNNIADTLAKYYSTSAFVSGMNSEAHALDMASTTFADASGVSRNDVSTPEDLYRLAVYLANKKSFVWNITRTPSKTIVADDGSRYTFENYNLFSDLGSFVGGKVGQTVPAGDTMVSVFSVPVNGINRRVAIVILDSSNYKSDTQKLADWFNESTQSIHTACVSCSQTPHYPKIKL